MNLGQFFAVVEGPRAFSLSEEEAPLCAHDFWARHSGKPEWKAEIDRVDLIPNRMSDSGLWFDRTICLIRLKEGVNDA